MYLTREIGEKILKGDIELANQILERIREDAVEKALLMLPSVMGNLMTQHLALTRLGENFLKSNPEFKGKRDIVQHTLEEVESKNPGISTQEVLEKATPLIKERLRLTSKLDMEKVEKPQQLPMYGDLL